MKELSIGDQRLLQLVEHLEKGQLGHKYFDFALFNNADEPNSCGTSGCAIGECPIVWPNDWQFGGQYVSTAPTLRNLNVADDTLPDETDLSIAEWFELDYEQSQHLFFPHGQDPFLYGGELLEEEATKEQVAANIRAFVKKRNP